MPLTLDDQQQQARSWFEHLRDLICAEFTAIEREAGSDADFEYIAWDRIEDAADTHDGTGNDGTGNYGVHDGGGGVRGVMKGKVFEKVGVNVSTVGGTFNPEFAASINGADKDPRFFATGISLVAHMANPHVPAVHMNMRFLATTKRWFGGGADLNPPIPYQEDSEEFHAAMRAACANYGPDAYEKYKKWADDYFYIPHRNVHRGVGGIFYDHLEIDDQATFDRNFTFTKSVGEAFLGIYPTLVRKRMDQKFSQAEKLEQLKWRGRYAEFNLIYDRGTLFGLKTGGNIDAILMSLPPEAIWE